MRLKTKKFIIFFTIFISIFYYPIKNCSSKTGSSHEFTKSKWNLNHGNCSLCHTKESSELNFQNNQIWSNRNIVYSVYRSSTLDAHMGQPGGISKLCLSCHDGTIAQDNFFNNSNNIHSVKGKFILGSNLDNDHPVSFIYDSNLAFTDGGLADPMTAESGLGGTIYSDLLVNGKVECSSCHDVHNVAGTGYSLKKSNFSSSLCLTCHKK